VSAEEPAAQHLSIGEVLSLVQEEFPDVSISKIRFLESQGLIAPERTASGYRKFYDPDIDRLRWILRQQRDHFLPLKVIKKMLDQGVGTAGEESQPSLFEDGAPPARPPAAEGRGAPDPAEPPGADPADDGREAPAPPARDGDEPTPRSPAHPAVASAPAGSGAGRRAATREPRQGHATPADVVAALQEGPAGSRAGTGRRRSVATTAMTATERLTREELLEASGLDDVQLDELERYGLLSAVTIGNSQTYDAEGLEVARLAVRYAALGVEARHLRMYKVAAEREAGFVEQLVVPLLKQRNPTARQQAATRVDELAEMGAELHAALLRQRLGPVIGP
jgi:DNA-binding transcriptional MerR regulator